MGKDKKSILGVGDYHNLSTAKYHFNLMGSEMTFDKKVYNVADAIDEINSDDYQGVLIYSLVMSTGKRTKECSEAMKKFEKFDNPPYAWVSGGLHVIEHACEKGLITVVNEISEEGLVLAEAEKLGAKCFRFCEEDLLEKNFEYFKRNLWNN